jgi:hypothetical protein
MPGAGNGDASPFRAATNRLRRAARSLLQGARRRRGTGGVRNERVRDIVREGRAAARARRAARRAARGR